MMFTPFLDQKYLSKSCLNTLFFGLFNDTGIKNFCFSLPYILIVVQDEHSLLQHCNILVSNTSTNWFCWCCTFNLLNSSSSKQAFLWKQFIYIHGQPFLICANNKSKTIQASSKAELWGYGSAFITVQRLWEYRKLTVNFLAVKLCFTSWQYTWSSLKASWSQRILRYGKPTRFTKYHRPKLTQGRDF